MAGDELVTTTPSSRIFLSHPEIFRRLNPIGHPQVEQERLFPWRQTYARYLHVAEAVAEDEAQAAWTGLGGRLKALRREVAEVKAGQSKADAGQAEAKADMEEMKAEMADMKALLEKLVAQSLQNAA